MEQQDQSVYQPPAVPEVREIDVADVRASLRAGWKDFLQAPGFGLFFGGVFAAGGLLILALLSVFDMPWMIIPLAIGFPLIGPFVAAGLYAVSRNLAAGRPLKWTDILILMYRQRERQLSWMAFLVLFVFWIWIYQVRILLALFLGFKPIWSIQQFTEVVLMTPNGIAFLFVGTLIGFVLAMVLFASTVIAIPLLLDRELDFVTAIITSFKTVIRNPVPMLGWGVVVTFLAVVAMLPAFLGLVVVFPVLGHATWHLYTRAVEPAGSGG